MYNMSEILKLENEGLAVEFEVIPAVSETDIKQSGNDIDAAIIVLTSQIKKSKLLIPK